VIKIKVFVASKSTIKIEAARSAVSQRYPYAEIIVEGIDVPSGVSPQPHGLDETTVGAQNRLAHLEALHPLTDTDILISIENGLVLQGGRYHDIGVVIIKTLEVGTQIGYTRKVTIPKKAVKKAQKRGPDTNYGDILAEQHNKSWIAKDPHRFLTGIPRKKFLEEALAYLLEE